MTSDASPDEELRAGERLVEETARMASAASDLAQEVARLQEWKPRETGLRRRLWHGFLLGIAAGLGRAVGATVILALLIWVLGRLEVVPVLGGWIARLVDVVETAQP
jgi:hypothetical protein